MKSTKRTIALLGIVALLVNFPAILSAQTIHSLVCKGSQIYHTIGAHRGYVQWEQSPDGINWQYVPFMSADTFGMSADTNGYYRAMVIDGQCAPIYTEVRWIQVVELQVDAGNDASFCPGSSVTLGGNPTVSGGRAPYAYAWTAGAGLDDSIAPNPLANPSMPTTYILMVTDSSGCIGMDTVVVTPLPAVVADAGSDRLTCAGATISIGGTPSGSGGTGPLNYLWTPSTGLSSATSPNPSTTANMHMTYVLLVSDSLGCMDSDTVLVDTNGVAPSGTMTFAYTGSVQTFVVPSCVDSITMDVYGAQGGANWVNNNNFGGRVTAKLDVTPGETLQVYVGQQPTSGVLPGWNGGGSGDGAGKGGGGASDVRRSPYSLNDRIIVAGAGGGAGYWSSIHVVGGAGGGLTGANGYRDPNYATNPGGVGASQTAGGPYGTCINFNVPTMAGSFGQGGTPLSYNCGCEGYGGGGGWYGGAGSGNCRGAGGGSSYTVPGASNVVHVQGARAGNGQVIFSW